MDTAQANPPVQTFDCPSCGAGLEYSGFGRTVRCAYCANSVAVPEELWRPVENARSVRRWLVYLVIFLVLTVVLPTCIGLFGALLGVIIPIFTALLGFIIQLFVH